MTEPTPLSPSDLRRILVRHLGESELQDLCVDLEVDYESLPAVGKAGKARELVLLLQRQERLSQLEALLRQMLPFLDTPYSPERLQELQASIMAASQPRVREEFVEFTRRIEAYLDTFSRLHEELKEWKELHNLLQGLQIDFTPCRSHVAGIGHLRGTSRREQERLLYEIEVEWRPCRRALCRLQALARDVQAIDEPFDPKTGSGPPWFVELEGIGRAIDEALLHSDLPALADHISAFGDRVDQFLYLADKSLRRVVEAIHQLSQSMRR